MDSQEARLETRNEAAQAGRVIYLVKKPCHRCGCKEVYTSSGSCVSCCKERAAARIDGLRSSLKAAKGVG